MRLNKSEIDLYVNNKSSFNTRKLISRNELGKTIEYFGMSIHTYLRDFFCYKALNQIFERKF